MSAITIAIALFGLVVYLGIIAVASKVVGFNDYHHDED